MEIHFSDPEQVPLPPDEIRFLDVQASPHTDGRRVKLSIGVTPFQMRPTIDVQVTDEEGREMASTTIVEATETQMSLTVHLRQPVRSGSYDVRLALGYQGEPPVDRRVTSFTILDRRSPQKGRSLDG